jgi:hypothetical protein
VGFADYELVGAVVDERGDLESAGTGPAIVATLDEARDAVMPLVIPGAEAESFAVYELVSGDKRVGAEVVFIEG